MRLKQLFFLSSNGLKYLLWRYLIASFFLPELLLVFLLCRSVFLFSYLNWTIVYHCSGGVCVRSGNILFLLDLLAAVTLDFSFLLSTTLLSLFCFYASAGDESSFLLVLFSFFFCLLFFFEAEILLRFFYYPPAERRLRRVSPFFSYSISISLLSLVGVSVLVSVYFFFLPLFSCKKHVLHLLPSLLSLPFPDVRWRKAFLFVCLSPHQIRLVKKKRRQPRTVARNAAAMSFCYRTR